MAAAHPEDHTFVYRRKAIDLLNSLLLIEPDHPGVAHYLIHACDVPQLAPQGLAAARRYASIAPASPHALHMPSHIFARLGLWEDDIQSNLASKSAAEKQASPLDRSHAMDFLEYAYLQTAQLDKAAAIEREAAGEPKQVFASVMPDYFYFVQVHCPALLALETQDWKSAASLRVPAGGPPDFQAIVYWAQAIGAAHLHDAAATRGAVSRYDRALEAVKRSDYAYVAGQMSTSRDEAHAWLQFAERDLGTATTLMRRRR